MDALSDVLRLVRLSGGVFLEAEFTAPWAVLSQVEPADCRPYLSPTSQVMAFHYVLAGDLTLTRAGNAPLTAHAGEIILLPGNDVHQLGSSPEVRPVDAGHLILAPEQGGLARIAHGGGGERTAIICGFLGTEAAVNPLLSILPSVLTFDVRGSAAGDWVDGAFRFAARELGAARVDAGSVVSRLSELLLVEAVRSYIADLPPGQTGWLAGLRDPAVGRGLALLHAEPARDWTAEDLARAVGMSRSSFTERFTKLVGQPPITYLTKWRLQVAAIRLRDASASIAQTGYQVGYESEAAFNRAFKREFGVPPAAWRRAAASAPEDSRA
jgi:AraC-like DNA-binding protein